MNLSRLRAPEKTYLHSNGTHAATELPELVKDPKTDAPTPTKKYESWGRYPKVDPARVVAPLWVSDVPAVLRDVPADQSVLAFGYGRSYGDSCLNEGNTLIDMTGLRRFMEFDTETGLLRAEAGVMLADVLEMSVPRGWFLPVTPGTKFVSIGGAIANDIHGKNHHVKGTFGRHVTQFELLRSDGSRLICSPTENTELFRATIGGLGLTGLILWAEFQMRAIPGPYISEESIRFRDLDEFFDLSAESDTRFEYTVSWVDVLATGAKLGRGLMTRGNHDRLRPRPGKHPGFKSLIKLPIDLPSFVLNPLSVAAFNFAYYNRQLEKVAHHVVPYAPFFYPLDSILDWNKGYGEPGFLQYQFVVPIDKPGNYRALRDMMTQIARSGEASFLVVLKTFGNQPSPGMLSFPRPGVTYAMDFPYRGERTLSLMERLDNVVRDNGGAVYPAKDARMSGHNFKAFFPAWQEFSQHIDPKFSSSFWRRVMSD